MKTGTEIFAKFAEMYAEETGCDKETAQQAAFVLASAFSDMVGNKEAGDHFAARAEEMEERKTGKTWKWSPSEASEPAQVTSLKPANEENIDKAYYRNSYWI